MRRGVSRSTVIIGAIVIVSLVAPFVAFVAFRSTAPSYQPLSTSATGSIPGQTSTTNVTQANPQEIVTATATVVVTVTAPTPTVTVTATATAPTPTVTATSTTNTTIVTEQNLPWMVPDRFVLYQVAENGTLTLSGTLRFTVTNVQDNTITAREDGNVHFKNGSASSTSVIASFDKSSTGDRAFFDTVSQGGSPELVTLNGKTYQTIKFSLQDGSSVFWVEASTRIVIKLVYVSQSQSATLTLLDTNIAIPTVSSSAST